MKNFQAHIYVKEVTPPKFCKARTVPFAVEESVKVGRYLQTTLKHCAKYTKLLILIINTSVI